MITLNRILIVDDHELFRGAVRDFLSQERDIQIVGEAGNMRDAIRAIGAMSPHLVLTDLSMPDTHGIEAVTEIRRCYPDMKILVISLHRDKEIKRLCRKAGAAGYIMKDAIFEELRDGIRIVLSGRIYLDKDALDEAVPDSASDSAANSESRRYCLH
jgi:DNA-binding NarL/FixJ family response regulator